MMRWLTPAKARMFFCPPVEIVTMGQMMDVVKKFLRDNPEIRHRSSVTLIAMAFRHAWPCKKVGATRELPSPHFGCGRVCEQPCSHTQPMSASSGCHSTPLDVPNALN